MLILTSGSACAVIWLCWKILDEMILRLELESEVSVESWILMLLFECIRVLFFWTPLIRNVVDGSEKHHDWDLKFKVEQHWRIITMIRIDYVNMTKSKNSLQKTQVWNGAFHMSSVSIKTSASAQHAAQIDVDVDQSIQSRIEHGHANWLNTKTKINAQNFVDPKQIHGYEVEDKVEWFKKVKKVCLGDVQIFLTQTTLIFSFAQNGYNRSITVGRFPPNVQITNVKKTFNVQFGSGLTRRFTCQETRTRIEIEIKSNRQTTSERCQLNGVQYQHPHSQFHWWSVAHVPR